MIYVALLRGINVGGKNKIEMSRLKACFERVGMEAVRTYINSGNVIFSSKSRSPDQLAGVLEQAIEGTFGFPVRVLVRNREMMKRTVEAMPASWVNNEVMRCDVIFLAKEIDRPSIVDEIAYRPEIEDLVYTKGALIWRIDRAEWAQSKVPALTGSTKLYPYLSIRNCNTARKLLSLMEA